jgi:hypothetical protein
MSDLTRSTAAILAQDAEARWQLVGGGVCLRIGPQAFLLSAGHVLAAITDRAWFGLGGTIAPLHGAAILGSGPQAPPEARTLDVGFAPLLLQDLASGRALPGIPLDAVDLDDGSPGGEYVAIAAAEASATTWHVIPARAAPGAAYRSCGVDAGTHVVVDVEGAVEAPGLVGGGVWRRRGRASSDLLTGIVVGVRPLDGGARVRIVATRAPFPVLGILGFLGVRPPGWMSGKGGRRASRRTH